MKKLFFISLTLVTFFISCSDDDNIKTSRLSEEQSMDVGYVDKRKSGVQMAKSLSSTSKNMDLLFEPEQK